MKGTTTVPKRSPIFSVRLPPISTDTPFSSPGDRHFGITFRQCMQRTQLRSSTSRVSSSFSESAFVGQRVTTLSMTYLRPLRATYAFTSSWSTFISSRHVPITAKSARSMEFMQSLGQPEILNLNL